MTEPCVLQQSTPQAAAPIREGGGGPTWACVVRGHGRPCDPPVELQRQVPIKTTGEMQPRRRTYLLNRCLTDVSRLLSFSAMLALDEVAGAGAMAGAEVAAVEIVGCYILVMAAGSTVSLTVLHTPLLGRCHCTRASAGHCSSMLQPQQAFTWT